MAVKREVHTDDWATFEIDPSLLDGTGLTLMPENYYQLANPNKMTISNPNLAIADVKVTFSDAFYNDNAALNKHYAIPFRLVDHNQDEISTDVEWQFEGLQYCSCQICQPVSWYLLCERKSYQFVHPAGY